MKVTLKLLSMTDSFIDYKKPGLLLAFPYCNLKCGEACQNKHLRGNPVKYICGHKVCELYMRNGLFESIIFGGLEPFDTFEMIRDFIAIFRDYSDDDIVIYTGYYPNEIIGKLKQISNIDNLYIKFGRYDKSCPPKYDDIGGVTLASGNQFFKKW